ncbi:MAG: mandelate racemase/muconate lactonizing enzyme family protein [Deltaproteobacteria bacterium]|nr:mandelate racemase/muconate lactonizing enzyme family protein [Deltaproteobacteria bacterium]
MKLTNAKAYVVKTDPPNWGGLLWNFIKLETDEGICGWGETAVLSSFYDLEISYETLVAEIFKAYLKGKGPIDREPLYHLMYSSLSAQHPDYVMLGLISAFDIALWDICGKYYNTPVYNLLGGKYRDKVRAYTYIYDLDKKSLVEATQDWTTNPARLGELAARLVDEGFTGVKFDPLPQVRFKRLPTAPWELTPAEYDHAERAIGAIREAVGTRADICIGTHGQITPASARRLAKRVEKFDPLWLEEPCPPENFKEMGRVAAGTSIPIATGERLVTVYEFQNLFAEGACTVAQPDLGSCGGITAGKKIATLAEANYVLMAPHVWGGPVITAAALQIDANIPNFLIQESIYKSRDFFDELVREPFEWRDGCLIPSDRPGIGIELDEEKLEKHKGTLADFRRRS